ncbi:MAG: ABC transporter permease [Pseudomonadota bacterium]|uniref:ABC transporter permease n=1 Tax=Polaromonas sp. TaxID=1869339 RepID=UPI00185AF187|nr:ABC transporter permease [Polaromonas sp.]MBA3594452.1 hypothetical protein [Polaromonas sp.]MDQ3272747.1 ABC transporter permease [Pseudomonadota bacterium]
MRSTLETLLGGKADIWVILIYRNLRHDRTRFFTAIFGVAFAALLIAFEGGLLVGFTHAASRTVDAIDADIWIARKGTKSFDLGFGVERRVKYLVRGDTRIQSAGEVVVGWAPYIGPNGEPSSVQIVGIGKELDHSIGHKNGIAGRAGRDMFYTDKTYVQSLGLSAGSRVEIAGYQLFAGPALDGYASFMGTPFVLSDQFTVQRILNYPADLTSFVALKLSRGASLPDTIKSLQNRFPELDVLSTTEFSWRSRMYWLLQTGAGGALILCALLGFAVGLAIVSQTIYAITMDRLDEYATLKAIGAPQTVIQKMIFLQAIICTCIGSLIGLIAVHGVVALATLAVGWCEQPLWMALAVVVTLMPMSLLAANVAAKPALRIEPAKAFRA